ncbi:hypothetical protein PI124_g13934 [Phytophthora idaei]|nr:hypothetical protein PI124_g13934 [Phytophthora idaei]
MFVVVRWSWHDRRVCCRHGGRGVQMLFGVKMETVASVVVEWTLSCSATVLSGCELASLHYKELLVAAGCVQVWTVTETMRSVTTRLFATASLFLQPLRKRWWKMFEAMPATPVVVVSTHEEHLRGLGRLLYKWIDAYHAYWCVFLPETVENGWNGVAKYWNGLQVEWTRTVGRSCIVVRVVWDVASLLIYSAFYAVLFVNEGLEGVCQGWIGVGMVLATVNYYYLCDHGVVVREGLVLDRQVVLLSIGVVMAGALSRIWYVFEEDGRSPGRMILDGYAE